MFGVPTEGATNIFYDNDTIFKKCSSTPELTIKEKHHLIASHRNREAVAAGTARLAKEDTGTNLTDLFTKILMAAPWEELLDKFMY
jgi:hypothetical protein